MLKKRRIKHKKSGSSKLFFHSSVQSVLAYTGVIFFEAFSPAGTIETQNSLISIELHPQVIPDLEKARQALIP